MDGVDVVAMEGPDALLARVQELQERMEAGGELVARELAQELVFAVVQMYGLGLGQIMDALFAAGEQGGRIAVGLADDPLLATLLLIHDLHPVSLEARVEQALASVRPYMESHGGNVELLSVVDGVARISLQGSCSDCSASSATLELAVKQALEEAAPDLDGLEVEGVAPQTIGPGLPMASADALAEPGLQVVISPPVPPSWFEIPRAVELRDGGMIAAAVAGSDLLVANVEGTLLAYRDACASCGGTLHDGELSGGALACPHCGRSFFLPRAGRSMDEERIQLDPVPLLRELGSVKVALAP